ncbi:TPA: hypothetical protein N0F65_010544 [Lagenidium giganteum]|uniref:DDE-1 domain-containing protein n=1 Tax=Lagenidium giganteum TaxID=4803 RepID=A0AAV2ZB75_9STRA|nr:TPA: hypothetical protein N0F65_010544 [Lagenidium giganteum]
MKDQLQGNLPTDGKTRKLVLKCAVPELESKLWQWLSKFKRRHNMRRFRLHGEEASADADAATKGQELLLMVTDQYRPEDVFNTDETGLVWAKLPTRTLSTAARSGRKQSKQRTTVLVTANAAGTKKLPLLYISHVSAWMKLALFEEWLGKLNERMVEQQRHILLLLDNASVHKTGRTFSNVRLHLLPPNTNSKIQPNDAGIIANLKHHYETARLDHAITLDDIGCSDPCEINLRQAMYWMKGA